MSKADILFQIGRYHVICEKLGTGRIKPQCKTFTVYRHDACAAVRVSRMPTLARAIAESRRRHEAEK